MTKNETLEVVERAIAGSEEALTQLCKEKGNKILYIAMGMMGNMHDAEEVMQEVLIILFQNIGKLRRPEFFDLWLYRVVCRECNLQRKRRAPKEKMMYVTDEQLHLIPEERAEFLPPEFAEDNEKRQMLLDVLDGLRPNYRMAVLLYYYSGLSYEQTARAMGVNVKMVDNYLNRARKKIRLELQKQSNAKFTDLFAAVPVPVLAQAMRMREEEWVSPQKVDQCIDRAKSQLKKNGRAGDARKNAKKPYTALKLIMGAVAAVLAVGIFVAQAGELPVMKQTSPLSSSATEAPVDPQPSGGYAVAEEELEINESNSPGAGSVPQTGPAQPGEAGDASASGRVVTGKLVLKDADGNVVEETYEYLSGVTVRLLDQNNNTAEEIKTDLNGAFRFAECPDGYAVQVETEGTQLVLAQDNPDGKYSLGGAGDDGDAVLYVHKTFDPEVTIEFWDGACECGHVNPKRAEAVCADSLDKTQSWRISDAAQKTVAAGDTGRELDQTLQSLPEGVYTLDWQVSDIFGNLATARRVFRIVDGEVGPFAFG